MTDRPGTLASVLREQADSAAESGDRWGDAETIATWGASHRRRRGPSVHAAA